MADADEMTTTETPATSLSELLGTSPPAAIRDLPMDAQTDLAACLAAKIDLETSTLRDALRNALSLLPWFLRSAISRVIEQ